MTNDELTHYGVKGMRWGFRKADKRPASAEYERTESIKTERKVSGIKALTNKELKDAIERMNLEKQYVALAPNSADHVKKFVKDLLNVQGKQEANKMILGQFKNTTEKK